MKGYILTLNYHKHCRELIIPLCKVLHKAHGSHFIDKRNCIIAHLVGGGNVRLNFPKFYNDTSNIVIIADEKGKDYLEGLYVQGIIKS